MNQPPFKIEAIDHLVLKVSDLAAALDIRDPGGNTVELKGSPDED